jgi:hypothetical protein
MDSSHAMRALDRRINYLMARVATNHANDFDKAELAAVKWAVAHIRVCHAEHPPIGKVNQGGN